MNFVALEECPGCGVTINLTPEIEKLDFSGKNFFKSKTDYKNK